MMRSLLTLVLLVSLTAFARPSAAEGEKVLAQFLDGAMGLNQAINRIQFLGMEGWACSELVTSFKRTVDRRRRAQTLEFLVSIAVRDPDVERLLLGLLGSDDIGEVMAASRGLARIKSDAAVRPLIAQLEHKLLGPRREAARALGLLGKPAASAPLLKAAKAETELDVKVLMIAAAGQAGDKKQVPAFEALLKEESDSTRLAAAQALCSMGSAKGVQYAAKLMASSDRHERLQGVMLFEGASAKVSSASLSPLLADKDDKVRARAARILVQGGDAKRLEWLVLESAQAKGEARLVYEDELEKLRLSDEQRQAILKKAGVQ